MILRPASRDELCLALKAANESGELIDGVDLRSLALRISHLPEDMTVSVEAGVTLQTLQSRLREGGQWLPIDPPGSDKLTVGALLATNRSGPRRLGYGTIREHLIGIKVALASGQLIKAGGNVVKNVAGYDLCKLFVGSLGALGCIVEATFKLLPLSQKELFLQADCATLDDAERILERTLASELTPVVLDITGARNRSDDTEGALRAAVIIGLAGSRAEVDWQEGHASELGFVQPTNLGYEDEFWSHPESETTRTASVLPSRLIEILKELNAAEFVARAANGVIHYRGAPPLPSVKPPMDLLRRMKDAYDPNGILPHLRW